MSWFGSRVNGEIMLKNGAFFEAPYAFSVYGKAWGYAHGEPADISGKILLRRQESAVFVIFTVGESSTSLQILRHALGSSVKI